MNLIVTSLVNGQKVIFSSLSEKVIILFVYSLFSAPYLNLLFSPIFITIPARKEENHCGSSFIFAQFNVCLISSVSVNSPVKRSRLLGL